MNLPPLGVKGSDDGASSIVLRMPTAPSYIKFGLTPIDSSQESVLNCKRLGDPNRQSSIGMKGTIMRWISRFLTSEEGDPVDPDETIINDAPYDAHKAIGSSPATTAAPGDRQGAPIAEEIKQRQDGASSALCRGGAAR